jgi:hypothetical protein
MKSDHVGEFSKNLIPPVKKYAAANIYIGINNCGKLMCCRYSGTNFNKTLAIIGDSHALSAYDVYEQIGIKKRLQYCFTRLVCSFRYRLGQRLCQGVTYYIRYSYQ